MGSDHVLCQRHKMLTTLFKQDYRRFFFFAQVISIILVLNAIQIFF